MNETYLHFIWKLKRLPFHQLTTTDGKLLKILKNGIHNVSESGPDFYNARIFYEEMEWAGQIEMHVKSSDWYKHGHQNDVAYSNVILHVVYEHDRAVFVNNSLLPTVELKNYIDWEHYENWERFARSVKEIPCDDALSNIDSIYLQSMMQKAIVERQTRKINYLLYTQSQEMNHQAVLYHLIGKAFGTKVNALPFELLTNQLPLSLLKRMDKKQQKQLVLHTSGLFDLQPTDHFSLPPSIWKRKGLRPPAFPEKRIEQFADFIAAIDFELLVSYLSPQEIYTYVVQQAKNQNLSENLINQLFVNAFVPYFWYKSLREENEKMQEQILAFLEELQPDDNHIIKKWKKTGVIVSNAYQSQALIELYNEYCT
ncbi:MAG TPA: DUF2851 family protein, partial [Taishania sp.]|nr:DUF2851 family protein [Taishania sp.]